MNVVVPASMYTNKQKSFTQPKAQESGKVKIKLIDFLAAVLGFFLGQAVLLKGLAPFGAGYLVIFTKYHPQRLTLISLGVGLGAFIRDGWIGLGVVVAALLGIYLIKLWEGRIPHDSVKGIIISGAVLGFHLLIYSFQPANFYQLLMGVLEALFILCLGWLFAEGGMSIFAGSKKRFERINLLAILFMMSGVIIGLPTIELVGINLLQVVIQSLILVAAVAGGVTHGTILGMFLGLSLALTEFHNPVIIGIYGFAGLTIGYFREYGKFASILGLTLVSLIFAGLGMVDYQLHEIFLQSLLVGVIFFMLPNSVITNLKRYLPGTGELLVHEENYQQELQHRFTEKLDEFAQVFAELGSTFKEVTAAEEVEEDDMSYFLYIISNRVCKGCDYESHCWEKQFYQTYTQIFKLLSVLENKGQAQGEDFVRLLKGHCRNLNRLKDSVDGSLEIYQLHRHWSKMLKNQQAIVGDQLTEVARVIEGFSHELDICNVKKEDLEQRLNSRLMEEGLKIISCRLTGEVGDEQLNIIVTKENCSDDSECRRIFKIINQMIPQTMTNYERSCGLEDGTGVCYLKFCPARNFNVKVGFYGKQKAGEVISGDTFIYQQLKSGKFMTILSDGMGTGEEAARESRSATRLIQRIIRAGFDHNLAVRTVNTALLSRSTEECFATVDISLIDLFNGELELIKIGASASFIKRGYEVNLVRGSSLPVGILQNVEPASFKRRLLVGDFVIMMTDGILDAVNISNKEDWMVRLLRQCSFDSPDDLAKYIYDQALSNGQPEDDMTVVVLKLEEEKLVH